MSRIKFYWLFRNLSVFLLNMIFLPITILLFLSMLVIVSLKSLDGSVTLNYPWQNWTDLINDIREV